jgi:lysophospholipase L1-like esterase
VVDQIEPYTNWWDEQNQVAADTPGPLLVAIGDSTALGIGASAPEKSYVGLLSRALTRRALSEPDRPRPPEPWRAINLGLSGARLQDALDRQVPILDELASGGLTADLVVCCIGTNDLVWGRDVTQLRARLAALGEGLPLDTLVGTLAGRSARGQLANRALRTVAAARELSLIDPWSEPNPGTEPRLAVDRFHPNDLGYRLMARPFARHLGIERFIDLEVDGREVPGSGGHDR